MEYGLGQQKDYGKQNFYLVLILVVMEYGLGLYIEK